MNDKISNKRWLFMIARELATITGTRDGLLNAFVRLRSKVRHVKKEQEFRRFCRDMDRDLVAREITAVILTVGAGTFFEKCLESIKRQNLAPARMEIVRDEKPFSKASQVALDLVKTQFYVPVDDDMILSPSCFQRLYHTICSKPKCAEALARLKDPIMGNIVGVRMYRTEIVRSIGFYPLRDEKGCERKMHKEIIKAGYVSINCHVVEGCHHPVYSPYEAYRKFRFFAEKARYYKNNESTFMEAMDKILDYWQRTHESSALYALAGLFEGLQSDDIEQELTYEDSFNDGGFLDVQKFLECIKDVQK